MAKSPDCIVVGGGVVGLTIARRLALEGLSVSLLERDVCGAEASWAAAGVLTPCNPHRRDVVAELRLRGLAMYPAFCASLRDESGVDPEYEPCGELEIALTEQVASNLRDDASAGTDRRLPDGRQAYALLSADEARKLEPAIAPMGLAALECRETAQVRNPRLIRALRLACERAGVEIREGTPVVDVQREGSRVTGVTTDSGAFSAGTVILCAGAWSSALGNQLQALMPVHPVRGQMILMKFEQRPFGHVIARGKTYLVPRRDGHVLLGATQEPDSGFNKRTTAKGLAGLIEKGMNLVPGIAEAPVVATWAGLRPGTPDDNPYIGPVPGFEGLIAATGHFRAGLTLAPITADLVAAFVHHRPIDLDLASCRPGRTFRKSNQT